jgi:hypothetical protein
MAVPSASQMIYILYYDNKTVIDLLNEAHALAEAKKAYGLVNFIEGRLDVHNKHQWMLSASMDTPVADDTSVAEETEEPQQVVESITEEVKTYFLNPKE